MQDKESTGTKINTGRLYKAGAQGGRGVIDIGKDNIGKFFSRTVWKDGSIVFKEVK